MSLQFQVGDRVVYVPHRANGDRNHKDCERGVVFRIGDDGNVYVKFQRAIDLYGDGQAIAQCLPPGHIVHEE